MSNRANIAGVHGSTWSFTIRSLLALAREGSPVRYLRLHFWPHFSRIYQLFAILLSLALVVCSTECRCLLDSDWSLQSHAMTNARLQIWVEASASQSASASSAGAGMPRTSGKETVLSREAQVGAVTVRCDCAL